MKKLITTLATLLILTATSNAANFECTTPADHMPDGMFIVDIKVTGDMTQVGKNSYSIKDYSFDLKIDCNESEEFCWAKSFLSKPEQKNNIKYNPRKYKNHIQFPHYLTGAQVGGAFGDTFFIVPKFNETLPKTFKSYMILTYIEDHFGTTAELNCKTL